MNKVLDSTTTLSAEALFRFTVVSQVINLKKADHPVTEVVRDVAKKLHYQLNGTARRVSDRTIFRWLASYEAEGLAGLEPVPQPRTQTSDVLPIEFLEFLAAQRRLDPEASVPELIRQAKLVGKLPATPVIRQTCWRALRRMGIDTRRRAKKRDRDSRRFAFPHRLNMVLADGKYFRAGAQRLRRVAVFFLDDATRFGLHVVVGTEGEKTVLFLRGLYEMACKYGIADSYYLDHGPGFISLDTATVIGRLPSQPHLVHGEAAYPEGHGKIERFNRTVKASLLRSLGRPDVDPDYRALELRLQHYLREVYNHEPHEGLNLDTPAQRFHQDPRQLRFAESDEWLRERFLITESRKVSDDHVISIDSTDYEVPRGYAGQRITIFRPLLENKVLLVERGQFIELKPVDLVANARDRRGAKKSAADAALDAVPVRTAADLAYERDFTPAIDADGGCREPKED